MPWAPKKICAFGGCSALTHERYCEAHKTQTRKDYERTRASAPKRGYGHQWAKIRRMVLRRQPICITPGCNSLATEVDHIKAKRQGGTDSMDNLQGLCKACHSRKSAGEGRWG